MAAVLHTGDAVTADVSDLPGDNPHIRPVDYPLDILWEEWDLLVLNKPAGIAIHPAALTEETVTVAGPCATIWARGASTASTAWTGAPPGSWWWPKPGMSTGCAWSSCTPATSAGPIWRCAAACPARRRGIHRPAHRPGAGLPAAAAGGPAGLAATRTMRPCGRAG